MFSFLCWTYIEAGLVYKTLSLWKGRAGNLWQNRDKGQYSKSFSLFCFFFFSYLNFKSKIAQAVFAWVCPHKWCDVGHLTPPSFHSFLSVFFPLSSPLWGTHTWMLGGLLRTSSKKVNMCKLCFYVGITRSSVHIQQHYVINTINTEQTANKNASDTRTCLRSGTGTCKICLYKKHALFFII